ncbi:MAG: bacteriohemerythrin [Terracidiphilus sp.]|nr:bacteriohemerythrin [Terracidiphilus sp.]
MALITWTEKLSVGVKSIDTQHAVLCETLNELHAAMMKGQARVLVGTLLRTLVDYTHHHFAAEEAMLAAANYPGLAPHRIKHRELTKQVEEYMARYEQGDVALSMPLLNFLSSWLTSHIQSTDKEYGPWLNQHGVR